MQCRNIKWRRLEKAANRAAFLIVEETERLNAAVNNAAVGEPRTLAMEIRDARVQGRDGKPNTVAEFIAHGLAAVEPAFQYYIDIYNIVGSELLP